MERVGVRELRQHASKLLELVEGGAVIEITNHGRPVARLMPAEHPARTRENLLATGDLLPGRGVLLDVTAVEAPPGSPSTDEVLADLRRDR